MTHRRLVRPAPAHVIPASLRRASLVSVCAPGAGFEKDIWRPGMERPIVRVEIVGERDPFDPRKEVDLEIMEYLESRLREAEYRKAETRAEQDAQAEAILAMKEFDWI